MYYNSFGGGAVYRLSAAPSLRRQNKTAKAPGTISQGLILRLSKIEILKFALIQYYFKFTFNYLSNCCLNNTIDQMKKQGLFKLSQSAITFVPLSKYFTRISLNLRFPLLII